MISIRTNLKEAPGWFLSQSSWFPAGSLMLFARPASSDRNSRYLNKNFVLAWPNHHVINMIIRPNRILTINIDDQFTADWYKLLDSENGCLALSIAVNALVRNTVDCMLSLPTTKGHIRDLIIMFWPADELSIFVKQAYARVESNACFRPLAAQMIHSISDIRFTSLAPSDLHVSIPHRTYPSSADLSQDCRRL